jgi:hypothetical protein
MKAHAGQSQAVSLAVASARAHELGGRELESGVIRWELNSLLSCVDSQLQNDSGTTAAIEASQQHRRPSTQTSSLRWSAPPFPSLHLAALTTLSSPRRKQPHKIPPSHPARNRNRLHSCSCSATVRNRVEATKRARERRRRPSCSRIPPPTRPHQEGQVQNRNPFEVRLVSLASLYSVHPFDATLSVARPHR